jgi:tetratricopeptide (TPR) repeat protein
MHGFVALMVLLAPFLVHAQCEPSKAKPADPPQTNKTTSTAPQFYDEPQFTVAGVADATNLGGHGSDTVVRAKESLAKDTVSLSKQAESDHSAAALAQKEKSLRQAIERDSKNAALHHRLGGIEEEQKRPLEAVREYQRAAELSPTEPYLFDWGTELLAHRAHDPAIEVFTKGNRLFPNSVRMLIGLGVAWHARGSYERAADCICAASDLNPADQAPYLFLAKMQNAGLVPSVAVIDRLARFARLYPQNALANYYYAAALWRPAQGTADAAVTTQVVSLLDAAVHLDPKLGPAYLLRGIIYAEAGDSSKAIAAFQRAAETNPQMEEPHYRLALAYRRAGEKLKAQQELNLYEQLSKKTAAEAERERLAIPQFVVALRDPQPAAHPDKP